LKGLIMGERIVPLFLCLPAIVAAAPAIASEPTTVSSAPRLFQSDGRDLANVKERLTGGDKELAKALATLRLRADEALKAGLFTIVHKPKAPSSGDKHDYVSMAPYFWPDPTKKDGLPYIRRDGRVNPERERYDRPLLRNMSDAVGTLGLAYYLSGDERYAAHAAKLLHVWFLDSETRMNPNLNYAQFVPGVNDGRGTGIIDSVAFLQVIDAVGMLRGSRSWAQADQRGVEAWFRDYLHWLRTSPNGKEEAAAANNHGTWYDAQAATYALFVGQRQLAWKVLEDAKTKRIARQIELDGSQPLELKRTRSFDYSQVNLRGLFALATLGEHLGDDAIDLWRFETKDGRSIRKALDWLIPYALGEKKWEHEQLNSVRGGMLASLLRRAAKAYQEPRYERLLEKLPERGGLGTIELLYPLSR
jgi:hypothetical protein